MEDKYKWIKQSFLRLFILTVVIVGIVCALTWKVMEASVWLELGKWVVIAVMSGAIACLLFSPLIGILDTVRDRMFPEYGKRWWLKWIKNGFKSN